METPCFCENKSFRLQQNQFFLQFDRAIVLLNVLLSIIFPLLSWPIPLYSMYNQHLFTLHFSSHHLKTLPLYYVAFNKTALPAIMFHQNPLTHQTNYSCSSPTPPKLFSTVGSHETFSRNHRALH